MRLVIGLSLSLNFVRFLKDFQKTAHLSASDRLFQGMANSFMKGTSVSIHTSWGHDSLSRFIDKIPSAKVQKRVAENKLEPIGDYLVAWNHVGVALFVAYHPILTGVIVFLPPPSYVRCPGQGK